MMKITLQVNGREMTFSEDELTAILEKHFDAEEVKQEEKDAQATETQEQTEIEVPQTPTEGKWFEVNPTEIDQSLFLEERADKDQERTRQLILEAFAKMKDDSKYARSFKTLMPKKRWIEKYVYELKEIACNLGDHMADWVEQALEWAQRIANGETWEAVCNDPDIANWYRLVEWKNGYARHIGGANYPTSRVNSVDYYPDLRLNYTVPLVVAYDK